MYARLVLFIIMSVSAVLSIAAPTAITDLRCSSTGPGRIECFWTTPTPTPGFALTQYDCRYSLATSPTILNTVSALNWATRTQVTTEPSPAGQDIVPGVTEVNMNVTGLLASRIYTFGCKTQDTSGTWSTRISNVPPPVTTYAATRSAKLAWDPSPDPQVTRYELSAGPSSGNYTQNVDTGNTTNFTLIDLGWTRYYIAVRAVNDNGEFGVLKSEFSNEVILFEEE